MKCFRMLTFLPLETIEEMETWSDDRINEKKELLAHELTELVHGKEEADKAQAAAKSIFLNGGDDAPEVELTDDDLQDGRISASDLLVKCGLAKSRNEARRLLDQGGAEIGGEKAAFSSSYDRAALEAGLLVRRGKKNYKKAIIK